MLTAQQACAIVLDLHAGHVRSDGTPERFVIQSCVLSAGEDYWVVRCNSEDYVVRGRTEYCYVGVNAHLVDVKTGTRETVASCFSVEEYLQDKADRLAAGSQVYVLVPVFTRDDKPALINLRQKLGSGYPQVIALLSEARRQWLTGTRRQLQDAQRLLESQGIATGIELHAEARDAVPIGPECWYADAVLKAVGKRLI